MMTTRKQEGEEFVPTDGPDNDMSLWPSTWDRAPRDGVAAVDPCWIEPRLLPFYRRTAEHDAELMARLRATHPEGPDGTRGYLTDDPDNLLHGNGKPVPLHDATPAGREIWLHYENMREAMARWRAVEARKLEETRDWEATCHSCGQVLRGSVQPRTVGRWVSVLGFPAARLCDPCFAVIVEAVEERRRSQVASWAEESLPGDVGSRGEAVEVFLELNAERILGT